MNGAALPADRERAAFDAVPFGLAVLAMPEGRILRVNPAFCRMFETTPEEVCGKTSFEAGIASAEERARVRTLLAERGVVRGHECVRHTPAGKARVVSLDFDWLGDASEGLVLLTVVDVFARRAADVAAAATSRTSLAPRDASDEGTGAARVLVVGADASEHDAVRAALPDAAVELADREQEAVACIVGSAPALVVLGAGVDLERTVALARSLHSPPIGSPLSVLHLVGAVDPEQRARLLRAGAHDYLEKPFATEELHARATALLRASSARRITKRLAGVLDLAPDGIVVADRDGRCIEVNAAACRLLGAERHELLNARVSTWFVPTGQHTGARSLFEGGVREWNLRRRDGTILPVEISVDILPDGGWQGFVRDIRARKEVERELQRSEARYRAIVSSSADAIISADADQRIRQFNRSAEAAFGYTQAEAIGAPLAMLVPARFRDVHAADVAAFARADHGSGRSMTAETRFVALRKDGEEFPAEATIAKSDVAGEPLLTVTLRDISKRVRAERIHRVLADAGEVSVTAGLDRQRLLEGIADVLVHELGDVCIVDLLDGPSFRRVVVQHVDPSKRAICEALRAYPLDRREAENTIFGQVVARRAPVVMSVIDEEFLANAARSPEHLRVLRELGLTSFVAAPLVARGEVFGVLGLGSSHPSHRFTTEDMFELEQIAGRVGLALDNARLYDDVQAALAKRDEVLGIVAHDLRTPLNAISLQAQALRRRGKPERRDTSGVDKIYAAARRMNCLVQDLLDVSRLEGGEKLRVSLEPVLAEDLVVAARQEREDADRDHRVVVDVHDSPGPVQADRARILQVFDNLVGNAMKFSTAPSRVTIGAAPDGPDVLFWVADEGTGIAPEALSHVFERFWQERSTDRRGTGLGLSIVKAIVEAHHGRIWVESTLGRGTTFRFTIPRATAPWT